MYIRIIQLLKFAWILYALIIFIHSLLIPNWYLRGAAMILPVNYQSNIMNSDNK